MRWGSFGSSKARVSCHYSPLIKSYTMAVKPKPQIETKPTLESLSVEEQKISDMANSFSGIHECKSVFLIIFLYFPFQ